ncbi:MAG: TlpA family protein disulfide reductase [Chloroflexi bacterium]|nr:TlpA family protein disulfide reductase [Chloroflexota bacterium]
MAVEEVRGRQRITGVQVGLALVGLALIGLTVLLAWGFANRGERLGVSGRVRGTEPARDFQLALFSGETVRLSDFRGRPVVVNFWATWCAPCRVETPILVEVYKESKDAGVVFIGVNIQDTEADALRFIQAFGIPYLVGPDSTGKIVVDYGVGALPVTFFIDRAGVLHKRWEGAIDRDALRDLVAETSG